MEYHSAVSFAISPKADDGKLTVIWALGWKEGQQTWNISLCRWVSSGCIFRELSAILGVRTSGNYLSDWVPVCRLLLGIRMVLDCDALSIGVAFKEIIQEYRNYLGLCLNRVDTYNSEERRRSWRKRNSQGSIKMQVLKSTVTKVLDLLHFVRRANCTYKNLATANKASTLPTTGALFCLLTRPIFLAERLPQAPELLRIHLPRRGQLPSRM